MSKGIVTILVGDAHDLTLGQYYAYRLLNIKPSVTIIDRQIDFSKKTQEGQYNFLNQIIGSKKDVLQSFSLIGYQGCFADPDLIKKLDSPKYSFYRLGKFKNNIQEAEPVIREAHMLSFDMGAVRLSDAPAGILGSPNGFYAEDACQLAKYAGMNDKLTSLGLYGFDMRKEKYDQTAQLIAQMIWYFTDGFYNRKKRHTEKEQPKLLYLQAGYERQDGHHRILEKQAQRKVVGRISCFKQERKKYCIARSVSLLV